MTDKKGGSQKTGIEEGSAREEAAESSKEVEEQGVAETQAETGGEEIPSTALPEPEAPREAELAAAEEVEARVEQKEAEATEPEPEVAEPEETHAQTTANAPKKGLMQRRKSFSQGSVPNAHRGYNPKTPVVMLGIIAVFLIASFILAALTT